MIQTIFQLPTIWHCFNHTSAPLTFDEKLFWKFLIEWMHESVSHIHVPRDLESPAPSPNINTNMEVEGEDSWRPRE